MDILGLADDRSEKRDRRWDLLPDVAWTGVPDFLQEAHYIAR